MRRVSIFHPEHRLKALLARPGGITAAHAVARAHERLEAISVRCLAGLDDKIDALAETFAPAGSTPRHVLIAEASEIFAVAALFAATDIARAAASLCDLLMFADEADAGAGPALSAATANPLYLGAVAVHIDALRRLRRPERGGDETGREQIVAGLVEVVRKFVGPEHARAEELCAPRAAPAWVL